MSIESDPARCGRPEEGSIGCASVGDRRTTTGGQEMTVTELTAKYQCLVEYLRQREQDHDDEIALLHDDLGSLLERVADLESRLEAVE